MWPGAPRRSALFQEVRRSVFVILKSGLAVNPICRIRVLARYFGAFSRATACPE
jgi:hypothetical protein